MVSPAPTGLMFGLPVVLDSNGTEQVGQKVLLKQGDTPIAVMEVESKWAPNAQPLL
jgi:ATP sulfurylase